jgi:hypothetical protein
LAGQSKNNKKRGIEVFAAASGSETSRRRGAFIFWRVIWVKKMAHFEFFLMDKIIKFFREQR